MLFAALLWASTAFVYWREGQLGTVGFLVHAGLAALLLAGAVLASPRRPLDGGLAEPFPGPEALEGWSREELEAALAALDDLRDRGRLHGAAALRAEAAIRGRLEGMGRE